MSIAPLRIHATLRGATYDDDHIDVQLRLEFDPEAVRLSRQLGDRFLMLMLPDNEPEPAVEAAEPEPQAV